MEALTRNIMYHTSVFALDFENFDEDVPENEMIYYPADNQTDSDDDTL
jgi:hypothetical protein